MGQSKKVWGWMMWDWAAQPYFTLLVTFIFTPYFASEVIGDPARGQSVILLTTSIVGLILAVTAPIFGAIADQSSSKKNFVFVFSIFYVIGAAGLWFAQPGMQTITIVLILFAVGLFAAEIKQVFVNSMLPDMGEKSDLGRIGGKAWALGYIGGLLALFVMLLFFFEANAGKTILGAAPLLGLDPTKFEGTRAAGPLVAIWYVVFVIPFFLFVPEVTKKKARGNPIKLAISSLRQSISSLEKNRSFAMYLASSLFYRDALVGVYAVGGIYAAGVLDWSTTQLAIFGIVGGIASAIFTYLGGFLDKSLGPKRTIILTVSVLIGVCIVLLGVSSDRVFGVEIDEASKLPSKIMYAAGALIGAAGGVIQSASRTMLVYQSDPKKITESFGLYALAGKSTAWITTLFMGAVTALTGSQQLGVLPVILFLITGLGLLFWVNE